ncbi:MAG: hypothetical protein JSV99_03305 [Planctomycetota bacterium]|nr:MAG: hypothetical protein JSV99_03305 [Planctomycetota bacterium]
MVRKMKMDLVIAVLLGLLTLCGSAEANDVNLVAHWTFDEGSGTVAYDSAGSNHGTLVNAPVWSSGQVDGALSFDGINDYVVVADDSSLDIAGAISFGAWIKLNDNVSWQIIVSKRGPGGGYPYGGYTFHFQSRDWNTGGAYRLLFTKTNGVAGSGGGNYGTNTNWDRVASNKDDWEKDVWYHVASTWDGSTNPDSMKLYINGEAEATHTASQSFIKTNSYNLTIGDILPQLTDPFNGIIDEVMIFNRALSAEEIEELYWEGFSWSGAAIGRIEDAIAEKLEALETIDAALEEELAAYDALDELLDSRDYGDLRKSDIIKARQRIHSAMRHQEQSASALQKSIEKLEDALLSLGWEPEPEPNEPVPEPNVPEPNVPEPNVPVPGKRLKVFRGQR